MENGDIMSSSRFRLETEDGVAVHVQRWEPTGSVRGVVQLTHGLGEHGDRYARLAAALTGAGWAVYADDHRGHGRSVASADDLGYIADEDGWALLLDDMTRLTRRARADHPGLPLVLYGHSMGANLVLQHLATAPGEADAAVLTSPASPAGAAVALMAALVRLERLRQGKRGRSALLEKLVFGTFSRPFQPVRTPLDWAMRDPQEIEAALADPTAFWRSTNQLWVDDLRGHRAATRRRALARIPHDLPMLVLAGTDDPAGDMGKGVQALVDRLSEAGLRHVTLKLYPGGRHALLNDLVRDEVIADLVRWLATIPLGEPASTAPA
jgi:alpha-beta hydrolase superfamily lysophospholipase